MPPVSTAHRRLRLFALMIVAVLITLDSAPSMCSANKIPTDYESKTSSFPSEKKLQGFSSQSGELRHTHWIRHERRLRGLDTLCKMWYVFFPNVCLKSKETCALQKER